MAVLSPSAGAHPRFASAFSIVAAMGRLPKPPKKLERGQSSLSFLAGPRQPDQAIGQTTPTSPIVQSQASQSIGTASQVGGFDTKIAANVELNPLQLPSVAQNSSFDNIRPSIVPLQTRKSIGAASEVSNDDTEPPNNNVSLQVVQSKVPNSLVDSFDNTNTSIVQQQPQQLETAVSSIQYSNSNTLYYLTEDEKAHFEYTQFAGYINYILVGHLALAYGNSVHMKKKVKEFLTKVTRMEFLIRVISSIPTPVQSALNGENWAIRDLLWSRTSHMTGRKGLYFGAGFNNDEIKPIGYGGQAKGLGGLLGRVSNHLSPVYRQKDLESERPKYFYKWVAGLIDKHTRRLEFAAFAYMHYLPDEDADTRIVITDIMESIMITLLGLFDTSKENHNCPETYSRLAPPGFKCIDSIIGTNRIGPCEHFGQVHGMGTEVKLIDESISSWELEYEVKYEKHPFLPVFSAYILFSPLVRIPLSMKVLQRFRVRENDKVTLRFDLWHSDTVHPHRYIQESVSDREAFEAYRLGIEVTGVTDDNIWSFWLKRNTDSKDWRSDRPTPNHVGIATAMAVVELLQNNRQLPVPSTRIQIFSSDTQIISHDGHFPDLTATDEYLNRVTYRARDYTFVMDGNQLHMNKDSFEKIIASVCVCDLPHFDCNAKTHIHKPLGHVKVKPKHRLDLEHPCPHREEVDCPWTFKDSNKAHQHAKADHSDLSAEKIIPCTFPGCDRMFARDYHLTSHLRVHARKDDPTFAESSTSLNLSDPENVSNPADNSSRLISASDGDVFTDTTTMNSRWVDNGQQPPYAWKDMIGMILLDHKLVGNIGGLDFDEIIEKMQQKYSYYAGEITDSQRRGGWPLSIQRVLKKESSFFVKRGKDDRSLVGKKGKDKWIVLEAKEDDFLNPKRNLTKRAQGSAIQSISKKAKTT